MLSKERAYELIDVALQHAKDYQVRVLVMSRAEGLTRYANSEIHQNVFEDSTEVTITVTGEKKRSRIQTTIYEEDELRAAVDEAIENLSLIPEGEEQPLPATEPELIEADAYNQELAASFSVEHRARLVKDCLATLDPGYMAYGKLTYQDLQAAFGNTEGVKRCVRANGIDFSALIELEGESGGTGYAATIGTSPDDIDILGTFARACDKAKLNQNRQEIEPGPYTVILEPLAVSNLLGYMSFVGFSGKSVQNRISFLTGKKGEKVFSDKLTLVDDHTSEHTVTLPFDFEGYPRKQVTLVEEGVVRDLIYDAASAQKDDVENTGHSVDMPQRGGMPLHLVMAAGDQSLDELIADSDDALLITRFHYMNVVNPREGILTGLTRDGVFHVKDGEVVGAVKNMRFTDSMLRAFANVLGVSSERERVPFFFGNYYLPAVKIDGFMFTGKTDA